jgi:hypothetical protein
VSDGDAIQKNVVYRIDFVLGFFLTHLFRLLRFKPRLDAISSVVRSRLFSLSQPTTQPSLSSIQEQCRVYISAKQVKALPSRRNGSTFNDNSFLTVVVATELFLNARMTGNLPIWYESSRFDCKASRADGSNVFILLLEFPQKGLNRGGFGESGRALRTARDNNDRVVSRLRR